MYSSAAILVLENRIGFGQANLPSGIVVSDVNTIGTSGRTLPYFHKLATLKNIYYTTEEPLMDSTKFNETLLELKSNVARQVLSVILDRHKEYRPDEDYSQRIISRPAIFDDAIGYTMASVVIEQTISTSQHNYVESSAKLSYQQLKMELEGVVDDNGRVRARGLKHERLHAIEQAADAFFHTTEEITIYDASDIW